jgi:putative transcriptional regulator
LVFIQLNIAMKGSFNLTGHILVAQPKGLESIFSKSVILVAKHGADGAWGVMVNKSTPKVTLDAVMSSTGISYTNPEPIYVGGPVEHNRVHVVHSLDWHVASTVMVTPEIGITSELSVMTAIAGGVGPKLYRACIGVSAWAAGQLEGEYKGLPPWKLEHRWLDAPATIESVFNNNNDEQWEKAIELVASNKIADWF